ncbi:hypothetical protein GCHA_2890 [Paraglaciecola chathamensis S18K6]|uniref:Uncharacterized protein n=1 Tax=Paraglaciecola chathamensis S18K6 TaxID=1127672 RepID=A0AAV3V241_9ALTE|nr:hypothetical protein GCHA_2890 [Paraglaciecola chathamensis S18K6]
MQPVKVAPKLLAASGEGAKDVGKVSKCKSRKASQLLRS